MNTMGNTIKCLRKAMGVTQDEMAQSLGVTYQAVSKWENDSTQPDIQLLPAIATYFGVTIDELFGYKLNVMTNKERLIDFMSKNQILCKGDFVLKNGGKSNYYIDAERFSTNAQISKIGEVFADCIRENNLEFDSIVVIMDRSNPTDKLSGAQMLAEKYGAKIYSLITDEDILAAREKGIITL